MNFLLKGFRISWVYFFCGIFVLVGANYSTFLGTSTNTDNLSTASSSYPVTKGDMESSIQVVGEASLINEQSMKFNKVGTITGVYFKAGESVKKGQVIAEIDNSSGQSSVENAQISLENAQISLNQLYDGPNQSNILQGENSINTAQNNYNNTKKELENLIATQKNNLDKLQQNIDNAQIDYENTQASYNLALQDYENTKQQKEDSLDNTVSGKSLTVQNIENNFRSFKTDAEKIINDVDEILGVTDLNKDKNDSYDYYLGAQDSTQKSAAKGSFHKSVALLESVSESLENYDNSGDREKIIALLLEYKTLFDSLYQTTDDTYKTILASIASEGNFSQSQINSLANSISSDRSTALSRLSSTSSSINTMETLTDTELLAESNDISLASSENSLASQKLALDKKAQEIENLKKSYDETVASQKLALLQKQQDLLSKETSLEVAKESYKELLEGPTDQNVKKAQNSVKQAQLSLESALKGLDDYKLIAPFDGVVRKIDYQVGDNITADTDKYVYIENTDLLQVNVKLDQIDINLVQLGQDATVTFDAYPTSPVKAYVSSKDTTPIQSSGVVSYEVKIIPDDSSFTGTILSGMTANIEIITDSRDGILQVKTSDITEKDGKNYVTVLSNGTPEERQVEIGLASEGMTEILSGLTQGEIIQAVTFSAAMSSSTETSTGLFPGGGPGNRDSGNFAPPAGF